MRILLLVTDLYNPKYKGGIQVFNQFLVRALEDLGHEFKIISRNDQREHIDAPQIQPCRGQKLSFAWHTFRHTLHFKPDLILCGHVNFSPLCALIAKVFPTPYIPITYGIDVLNLSRTKCCALQKSHAIIAISKYTKKVVMEQTNYPVDKIFLLPPAFDPSRFTPQPKPNYLMEKWNIDSKDKVILTIARLASSEQYKGYDKVIEIMDKVLEKIPDCKYILGGSGNDIERIRQLIKQKNLEDKVILPGYVPDTELVDYYNLCDLFVMPSKREGFGIVFLEALSCGKPVIAGNKDGSVDAVMDGALGILVNPDEPEEIQQAIADVLRKKVPVKLLDGDYLRDEVVQNYSYEIFCARVREFFF